MRYFFIIGTQKTGTSLLARVLDTQPNVACLYESYILRPRSSLSIVAPSGSRPVAHGFTSTQQLVEWQRRLGRVLSPPDGSRVAPRRRRRVVSEVMREVLDDFAQRTDASVVGDKWPWYADRLRLMLGAFPEATFINTVRDPRGLWLSAEEFKSRHRGDEILDEMLAKDARVRRISANSDQFITVRYEDLVRDSVGQLRRLSSKIGFPPQLPPPPYDRAQDRYPNRWGWIPQATAPPDPRTAERWQSVLDETKRVQIELRAAEFMEIYGY